MAADWSKIIDIIKDTEKIVFTEENLKKIVGSVQKGAIYLKHSQKDLTDLASKAGFIVRKTADR